MTKFTHIPQVPWLIQRIIDTCYFNCKNDFDKLSEQSSSFSTPSELFKSLHHKFMLFIIIRCDFDKCQYLCRWNLWPLPEGKTHRAKVKVERQHRPLRQRHWCSRLMISWRCDSSNKPTSQLRWPRCSPQVQAQKATKRTLINWR